LGGGLHSCAGMWSVAIETRCNASVAVLHLLCSKPLVRCSVVPLFLCSLVPLFLDIGGTHKLADNTRTTPIPEVDCIPNGIKRNQ
jgi:hypothetical protein